MSINYTLDLKNENGDIIFSDVECNIGTSVNYDPDEPAVSIDFVDIIVYDEKTKKSRRIHIGQSPVSFWRMLEGFIVKTLETDMDFYDLALEEAGITYYAVGANNQNGHYVQTGN